MKAPDRQRQKTFWRQKLKKRIAALSISVRQQKSWKIMQKVLKNSAFIQAQNVMIYGALSSEVQTRGLIQKALQRHKKVYMPRVNVQRQTISLWRVCSPKKDLKKGAYGIAEPCTRQRGNPGQMDLILVPGIGFDRHGHRLGRGLGFFDRFLKRARRAKKIGLAYREQIVTAIPRDSHDIQLDKVITD